MRSVALIPVCLLAGCASLAQPDGRGQLCDAAGSERFVGQAGTSESGAAIVRATHSSLLRWAPPGSIMTMEFSPSRVTVRLDEANRIASITCG